LNWWSRHVSISDEEIVYAGDSGNDPAAFTADYRVVVGAGAWYDPTVFRADVLGDKDVVQGHPH